MITKNEGAEDACPSCKQTLVCREVEYKGDKKLQWQYKDKEIAHFSYDFKSGKSACKESVSPGVQASTSSAPKDNINTKALNIPEEQLAAITEEAKELGARQVAILSGVQQICNEAGIGHPATIGMIYNQVCETRRYKGV